MPDPRRLHYGAIMASIGYARVSTRDQHAVSQHDALSAAGCTRIFTDTTSGRLANRPQLDRALEYLRDGEDVLMVTRLDRLGRSMINLKAISATLDQRSIELHALEQGIDTTTPSGRLFFHFLAALAEFERDLIVERTHEGLAAARARGRVGGRKSKLNADQVRAARTMYDSRTFTVSAIAASFGVTRSTIYRHLDADAPRAPRPRATTGPGKS